MPQIHAKVMKSWFIFKLPLKGEDQKCNINFAYYMQLKCILILHIINMQLKCILIFSMTHIIKSLCMCMLICMCIRLLQKLLNWLINMDLEIRYEFKSWLTYHMDTYYVTTLGLCPHMKNGGNNSFRTVPKIIYMSKVS